MNPIASSSAMLPPIAPQVRMLLDGLNRVLGVGNKCSIRWDRTGAATFELIGGEPTQWTTERIYGRLGRFSADCENPAIAISEPYLQYEVRGSDLKLVAGCTLPGMADFLAPMNAQAVGAGVSHQPVGAVGLMTIFSLLSLVWALLNPRVTLHLPGTLEIDLVASPDSAAIEFRTPPTITVVWGVRFTCRPTHMVLTEHSAEVWYRAAWFQKSKKWSW